MYADRKSLSFGGWAYCVWLFFLTSACAHFFTHPNSHRRQRILCDTLLALDGFIIHDTGVICVRCCDFLLCCVFSSVKKGPCLKLLPEVVFVFAWILEEKKVPVLFCIQFLNASGNTDLLWPKQLFSAPEMVLRARWRSAFHGVGAVGCTVGTAAEPWNATRFSCCLVADGSGHLPAAAMLCWLCQTFVTSDSTTW